MGSMAFVKHSRWWRSFLLLGGIMLWVVLMPCVTATPSPTYNKPSPTLHKPLPLSYKPSPAQEKPGINANKSLPDIHTLDPIHSSSADLQNSSPIVSNPSPDQSKPFSTNNKPPSALIKPPLALSKLLSAISKPPTVLKQPAKPLTKHASSLYSTKSPSTIHSFPSLSTYPDLRPPLPHNPPPPPRPPPRPLTPQSINNRDNRPDNPTQHASIGNHSRGGDKKYHKPPPEDSTGFDDRDRGENGNTVAAEGEIGDDGVGGQRKSDNGGDGVDSDGNIDEGSKKNDEHYLNFSDNSEGGHSEKGNNGGNGVVGHGRETNGDKYAGGSNDDKDDDDLGENGEDIVSDTGSKENSDDEDPQIKELKQKEAKDRDCMPPTREPRPPQHMIPQTPHYFSDAILTRSSYGGKINERGTRSVKKLVDFPRTDKQKYDNNERTESPRIYSSSSSYAEKINERSLETVKKQLHIPKFGTQNGEEKGILERSRIESNNLSYVKESKEKETHEVKKSELTIIPIMSKLHNEDSMESKSFHINYTHSKYEEKCDESGTNDIQKGKLLDFSLTKTRHDRNNREVSATRINLTKATRARSGEDTNERKEINIEKAKYNDFMITESKQDEGFERSRVYLTTPTPAWKGWLGEIMMPKRSLAPLGIFAPREVLAPDDILAPRGHHHSRSPRSAEKVMTPQTLKARLESCHTSSSCENRPAYFKPKPGLRYPCYCDELCPVYQDCCHDYRPPPPSAHTRTPTPSSTSCRVLMPTAHRYYARGKSMLLVDSCPSDSPRSLSDSCARKMDKNSRSYLMDIPVFSAASGFGYANIYCAKCHHERSFKNFTMKITCSKNITSTMQLADMKYHPGELRWTAQMGKSGERNRSGNQELLSCLLDINYPDDIGRWCDMNMTDTCPIRGNKKQAACPSYNYYVKVGTTIYKNWECAVCNGAQEEDINCLSLYGPGVRGSFPPPPSLMDLFVVDGDCEDDQVWDVLYRRCKDVFCGSLFTLQDGKCVRNNVTVDDDGRSYLNNSCYTWDFQRKYIVVFSNQSVYVNHTQMMYDFGEYEFNDFGVRICLSEDQWTPVMNIISTVLISISLVCLALHMVIFLVLPKRRNIPSMNLFSLTFSLFIVEFLFVCFFHMNANYNICFFIATILYYFLSAAFLWMNVMSIDICRTFHSNTYKIKSRKIFIQYSLYAWCVPFLGVVVAILVDQLSPPDSLLAPQFGTNVCWFNNKWGLMTFFTIPSGFVILANMVLFGMSVYTIYKQMKSGELASSTIRKNSSVSSSVTRSNSSGGNRRKMEEKDSFLNPSNPISKKPSHESKVNELSESPKCAERFRERIQRRLHAQKKQRVRLILYCKLAVTLGMTWVFAFISMHTRSIIFEYLFIAFNGLQGTFIFISFDFKRKVWEELRQKVTGQVNLRFSSYSGSNTKSSSVTRSSQAGYKYRWSSSRRQDGSLRYSTASQNQGETRGLKDRDRTGV